MKVWFKDCKSPKIFPFLSGCGSSWTAVPPYKRQPTIYLHDNKKKPPTFEGEMTLPGSFIKTFIN